MKITTASEMSAIDRVTSERYGVSSLTLMEHAGAAVAEFACEHWPQTNRITVICGKGNNGGDGLVAARHLHIAGKVVEVVLLGSYQGMKPDAAKMLDRLPLRPIMIRNEEELARECGKSLAGAELIIDAIFGTGYKTRPEASPAQKLAEVAITAIQSAACPVLSVDLPSGTDADEISASIASGAVVCRSDAIVTFTAPKPAHLLAQLTRGPIVVAPIGSPEEAIVSSQNLYAVTPQEVSSLFAPRALDSNKGRFGHVLVVGGSLGKCGAAAMSGMAALRSGAGLVTVATPGGVLSTVASFAPEMMTEPLGDANAQHATARDAVHCLEVAKSRTVLAVGPGLSQRPGVVEFVHRVVKGAHCPVVLDADGLNAFAERAELLNGTSHPVILTPHPGEMARLTGITVAEIQANRVETAREFSRKHRCILVLKGYRSVVAYPNGEVWVVASGNPGMATAGSGDILTGMIAGIVAQFSGRLDEAVRAAVFLHGMAGDIACEHLGEETMVATDLLSYLPRTFRRIRQRAAETNVRLC